MASKWKNHPPCNGAVTHYATMQQCVQSHTMEHYATMQMNTLQLTATAWMDFGSTMLGARGHSKRALNF